MITLKTIFTRLVDLFVKFLSVKGVFVIITSIAWFLNQKDENTRNIALVAWAIFIGAREFQKVIGSLVSLFGPKA